jgi:hypothetical protein
MGGMNTGLVGKGKREKKIYFIEREIVGINTGLDGISGENFMKQVIAHIVHIVGGP